MVSFYYKKILMNCKIWQIILLHIGDKMGMYTPMTFQHYNNQSTKRLTIYILNGETPEQDATLCLAILQGYNVSMYANPEDEDRKRSVLQRSLTLLDVLPLLFLNNSCLRSVTVCRNCVKSTNFLFVNENTTTF